MNQESIARFLEQFSTPQKNMADWPKWMQESTGIAAATLPKTSEDNQQTVGPAAAEGGPES